MKRFSSACLIRKLFATVRKTINAATSPKVEDKRKKWEESWGLLHCLKHSLREWLSTGMADKERVSTSIEVLEPPCVYERTHESTY